MSAMKMNPVSPFSKLGLGLLVFCLVAISPNLVVPMFAHAEDRVISVESDDKEMNAAIEKARASLPDFWAKFAAPQADETNFSVKLRFTEGEQAEHFWCVRIEGDATKATCEIDNDPQFVFKVKAGERVAIDPARISDWMYQLNGKIKGAQTIRVLLPRLPEDEAAQYRAMLADE